jgi:thiamine-phosphate pyrophosphorylase
VKPLSECSLYTFVDSAYLHGRDPIRIAEQLCLGGADLIQLRAKDWPLDDTAAAAYHILKITRAFGVRLVINDHLSVARSVGADICHLGQEDFFDSGYKHVSELEGSGKAPEIGLSTHQPEQARRAIAAGPAYIAIGPVFATGTKPAARPVTLEYVRWAAENVQIPWFAIGGINLSNLPDVLNSGARRICVVSAILNEQDVASACRAFKKLLRAADFH